LSAISKLIHVICKLQLIIMGSLYRSRHMTYCQILVPPEAAYTCVAALGEIGQVQFKDVRQLCCFFAICFLWNTDVQLWQTKCL